MVSTHGNAPVSSTCSVSHILCVNNIPDEGRQPANRFSVSTSLQKLYIFIGSKQNQSIYIRLILYYKTLSMTLCNFILLIKLSKAVCFRVAVLLRWTDIYKILNINKQAIINK